MVNSSNKTTEPYVFRCYRTRRVRWEVRVPYLFTDEQGGTKRKYFRYWEDVTTEEVPNSVKLKRDEFLLDPRCLVLTNG